MQNTTNTNISGTQNINSDQVKASRRSPVFSDITAAVDSGFDSLLVEREVHFLSSSPVIFFGAWQGVGLHYAIKTGFGIIVAFGSALSS